MNGDGADAKTVTAHHSDDMSHMFWSGLITARLSLYIQCEVIMSAQCDE